MCALHLVLKKDHLILDAYQDFIQSRKASLLAPKTIEFYEYTVGSLIDWITSKGITSPEAIKPSIIRAYISTVNDRGVSDSTVHAHARGTRAFLRFLNEEGYMPNTYKRKNASC